MCIFMGYGERQKGLACYDHVARRMRVSRKFVFLGNVVIPISSSNNANQPANLNNYNTSRDFSNSP